MHFILTLAMLLAAASASPVAAPVPAPVGKLTDSQTLGCVFFFRIFSLAVTDLSCCLHRADARAAAAPCKNLDKYLECAAQGCHPSIPAGVCAAPATCAIIWCT